MANAQPSKASLSKCQPSGKQKCNDIDTLLQRNRGSTTRIHECLSDARLQPVVVLKRIDPRTSSHVSSSSLVPVVVSEPAPCVDYMDTPPSSSRQTVGHTSPVTAAAAADSSTDDPRQSRRVNSRQKQRTRLTKDYVVDIEDESASSMSDAEVEHFDDQPWGEEGFNFDGFAVSQRKRKSRLSSCESTSLSADSPSQTSSDFRGTPRAFRGRGARRGRGVSRGGRGGRGGRGSRGGRPYRAAASGPTQPMEETSAEDVSSLVSISADLCNATAEHSATGVNFGCVYSESVTSDVVQTTLTIQSSASEDKSQSNHCATETEIDRCSSENSSSGVPMTALINQSSSAADKLWNNHRATEVDVNCIVSEDATSGAVQTTVMKPPSAAGNKMSSNPPAVEKLSKNHRASGIDVDGASSNDAIVVPVLGTLTVHSPAAVKKPTNDVMDSGRTLTMDRLDSNTETDMIVAAEVSRQTANVGARGEPEPSDDAQGSSLLQCTQGCICSCLVGLAPAEQPKLCGKITCINWCVCHDLAQETAESQEQLSDEETDSGLSSDEEAHAARTSGVHARWRSHTEIMRLWSDCDADTQAERNADVCSKLSPFALPLCVSRKMAERTTAVTPALPFSSNDEDDDQSVVIVSESPATVPKGSTLVSFASDRHAPRSVQYQPPMPSAAAIAKAAGARPPRPLRMGPLLPEPQQRSTFVSGGMTGSGGMSLLPPEQSVFVAKLGRTGAISSTSFSQADRQQQARGVIRVVLSPPDTALAPVNATLEQPCEIQRFEEMAQRIVPVEVKPMEGTAQKILDSLSTYGLFAPIVRGRPQTLEETLDTNDRLKAAASQLRNVPPLNVEGSRVTAMMVFSLADGQSNSPRQLKSHAQLRIICADSRWESNVEIRQRTLSLAVQLADDEPQNVTKLDFGDALLYIYPKNAINRITNEPWTASELAQEPRYMLLIMKRKLIVDQVVLPPPPLPASTFQRQHSVSHRRPMGQYRTADGPWVPRRDRSTSSASQRPIVPAAPSAPAVTPVLFTVPTSVALPVASPSISAAPDVGSSTRHVSTVITREGPQQLHNVESTSRVTVQSSSLPGSLAQVPASSSPTQNSLINPSMCGEPAKRGRPRVMKSIMPGTFSMCQPAVRGATPGKIAERTVTVTGIIRGARTIPGTRTVVRLPSSARSAASSPAVRWSRGVAPDLDEHDELLANQSLPAEQCPPRTIIRLPVSHSQNNQSSAVDQLQSPSNVPLPVSSSQVSGVLPFPPKRADSKSIPQEQCTEVSSPRSPELNTGQVPSMESNSIKEHTGSESDPVWSASTVSDSSPTNLEVKKTSDERHTSTSCDVATVLIESACTKPATGAAFSSCASSESTMLPPDSDMLIAKNINESSSANALEPLSRFQSIHPGFENAIKVEPGLFQLPNFYDHPDMVEPGVLMSVDIEEVDVNEKENGESCRREVGPATDINLNSTHSRELTSTDHVRRIVTHREKPLEAMFDNTVGTRHCSIRSSSDPINKDVCTSTVAGRGRSGDVFPDVGSLASGIGCSRAFSESANAMPNSEESASVSTCVVTSPAHVEQSTIATHGNPIAPAYLTYDECADFLIDPMHLLDASASTVEVPCQQAASFAASNPSSSEVHGSQTDCSFEYNFKALMANSGSEDDDEESHEWSLGSSPSSLSSFVDINEALSSPTDTNLSSAQRSSATRYLQSNANGHGSADGDEQDGVSDHTSPHRLVIIDRPYQSRDPEIHINSSGIQLGVAAASAQTVSQTTNAASKDERRLTRRRVKLVGPEAEARNFREKTRRHQSVQLLFELADAVKVSRKMSLYKILAEARSAIIRERLQETYLMAEKAREEAKQRQLLEKLEKLTKESAAPATF